MTILEQVAPGALAPGLAAGAVFVAAWLLARKRSRGALLSAGSLLAAAVGFAAGFVVVLRWPELPLARSTDGWYWVAWFAPAGVVLGLLELAFRVPLPARLAVRFLASAGAAWLILSPKVGLEAPERALTATVAAAGITLLWTVLAAARPDEPPERGGLPAALGPGLAAAVLAFFAGSLSMGQVTGGLSAALSACLALALLLRVKGPTIAAPTAAVTSLVYGGLLLSAYTYLNYGDQVYVPFTVPVLLLAGTVLGAWLPRLLAPTASRVLGAVLAAAPPLLLSGVAAWIAYAHAPAPNPYA